LVYFYVVVITDLFSCGKEYVVATANLLVEGFRDFAPEAWPDMESALEEVQESLQEGRISRIMVSDVEQVIGWVAGTPHYGGHSWELHPLVVHPAYQRQGIGRHLVADLEEQVCKRGGITLYLGSDDETGLTSLANIDLYPNPLEHLVAMQNLKGHPYEFYQKVGFSIVGVIPDANGFGKPDIFLAKRVSLPDVTSGLD
jgi:aminoglycoside 6'-N-acetyltransferase I